MISATDLACRDERRRQLIRERKLNGVDYADVKGTHLCVHFLTGIPPEFTPKKKGEQLSEQELRDAIPHIVIRGGRRVTGIKVIDVRIDEAPSKYEESCLGIDVDKEGDWSTYTLCFVETKDGRPTDVPMKSLDPRYACLDFTFKIDCPAEIDCKDVDECPPEERPAPPISYLAKDYATFRQLILDRLALTMPGWRERHVPDLGITLVEILAYAGDYLSYFQDAVATEQYLDTARQRISIRRHARLVDYAMHDGCNARAFLSLHVEADADPDPSSLYFITRTSLPKVALRESDLAHEPPGWLQFEPVSATKLKLRIVHNLIRIYTWGDEQCCLPKGSTRVTLLDEIEERNEYDDDICDERPWPPTDHEHHDHCDCGCEPPPPPPTPRPLELAVGDFLLFEELACAGTVYRTTEPGDGGFDGKTPMPDADRTHRHVVRITKITKNCDALTGNRLLDVEWSGEDALPFQLCVSAIGTADECDLVENLAVVRANIVLVDHGVTIRDEPLPVVDLQPVIDVCDDEDTPSDIPLIARRYRPRLKEAPLTFAQPVGVDASANAILHQNPRAALPVIALAAIPAAFDGLHPLFTPAELADLTDLAKALKNAGDDELLLALLRRLPAALRALIDKGDITGELLESLDKSLRAFTETWMPRADLLDAGEDDPSFVAEVDDDGFAHLRFGDGDCGRSVDPGMEFLAMYRAGNGRVGLVGPETIVHVVYRSGFSDVIDGVRNPLPSAGAADPEPNAEVKLFAPGAFRKDLERAVTADDYGTLAQYLAYPERNPKVQSASAALRWSGSWYEADVAVDPFGTSDLDSPLRSSIDGLMQRVRRMGHDLRIDAASGIPLRLTLDLCVKTDYLRAHVVAAVRDALSNRALPGGQRGFFHPDNLTFGAAVYISRIVAAVMAVEGVAEVHVVRLERLAHHRLKHKHVVIDQGFLPLAPNEIARLDNDPAAPENGLLQFRHVRGGR